jgi:3-isopropylmalate dehydratase small subunit
VIYNTPGTFDNQKNWRAGLNNNFEEIYYKNLQNNDILALNMPEITAKALYAKDSMEVAKLSKDEVAKMVERELEKPEDNDVKKKVLDFSKNIIKVDDHNEKNKLTDEFKHTLFKLAQDAKRNELNEKHKDLFNRLAHYEKILKEPDQYNDTQNKNGVVYKKPEETPVCC